MQKSENESLHISASQCETTHPRDISISDALKVPVQRVDFKELSNECQFKVPSHKVLFADQDNQVEVKHNLSDIGQLVSHSRIRMSNARIDRLFYLSKKISKWRCFNRFSLRRSLQRAFPSRSHSGYMIRKKEIKFLQYWRKAAKEADNRQFLSKSWMHTIFDTQSENQQIMKALKLNLQQLLNCHSSKRSGWLRGHKFPIMRKYLARVHHENFLTKRKVSRPRNLEEENFNKIFLKESFPSDFHSDSNTLSTHQLDLDGPILENSNKNALQRHPNSVKNSNVIQSVLAAEPLKENHSNQSLSNQQQMEIVSGENLTTSQRNRLADLDNRLSNVENAFWDMIQSVRQILN